MVTSACMYTPSDSPRTYLLPCLTVIKRALRASLLTRSTCGRVVPSHRLSVSELGFDRQSIRSANQRCPVCSHRCCAPVCCVRTAAGSACHNRETSPGRSRDLTPGCYSQISHTARVLTGGRRQPSGAMSAAPKTTRCKCLR